MYACEAAGMGEEGVGRKMGDRVERGRGGHVAMYVTM